LSEKVEVRKGLTPKALIIGLLIVVLQAVFLVPLRGYGGLTRPGYFLPLSIIFWVSIVAALLNAAKPGLFSIQELTVIFAMVFVGIAWSTIPWTANFVTGALYIGPSFAINEADVLNLVPAWHWGPTDMSIIESTFLTSTWSINWGAFAEPLGWGLTLMIGMCMSSIFLGLLLRHSFVVREALPFPFATLQTELVKVAEPENRPLGIFKMKFFWIGWIIMLLLRLPTWLGVFEIWAGSPAGARAFSDALAPIRAAWAPLDVGGRDLTSLGLLPWVPLSYSSLYSNIILVAFMLLMPTDVLNGAVLGWIVLVVISLAIQTAAGALPPFPTGTGSWGAWSSLQYQGLSSAFANYYSGVSMGILFAIFLYPIWVNRSYVSRLFGAISRPDPELDAESPIPYRYIWWGFILSSIIYIAGWIWLGLPPVIAVLFVFFLMIYLTAGVRVVAESGGHPVWWGHIGAWIDGSQIWIMAPISALLIYAFINPLATDYHTAATGYYLTYAGWGEPTMGMQLSAFLLTSLLMWKVGHETKTDMKDLFKAVVIAGLVSIFAAFIGTIYTIHVINFEPGSPARRVMSLASQDWLWGFFYEEKYWGRVEVPTDMMGVMRTLNSIILGFVYGLALYLLRAKLVWFRVNPAGAVLLLGVRQLLLWLPFIIAWIIKLLIVRFTKVEFFDKYVKPLCVGLLFSYYGTSLFSVVNNWVWRVLWWQG